MKLVCAIFMLYQNVFCYFFQASEEDKSDNDNVFKISRATYCSRVILDIFKSSQLFSLLSNLFLYSRNNLSQKSPMHRHISPLKKFFEKCKPVTLFSRFCGTLFQSLWNLQLYFFIWVFFHNHSRATELQEKEEGIF